jgi:hypothetical protein
LSRFTLAWLLACVIVAGYLLRFHAPVPEALRDAAGGAAYAVAAALGVMLLHPGLPGRSAAGAGLALTSAVEFLQLVQAPWLQNLRGTLLGRVVLGTTFSWGDFPGYAAGALIAWCLVASLRRRSSM